LLPLLAPAARAAQRLDDPDGLLRKSRLESQADPWSALRLIEEYLAAPGLSASQRAQGLRDSAKMRIVVGDYVGGERALKSALELEPKRAETLYQLALATRDRPEEAERYADQAAQAAGTPKLRADAERLAGEIRLDLGDAAGAEARVARALSLRGDDLDALQLMVRIKRDRPEEASVYARRADAAAEAAPVWARPDAELQCARIWLEIPAYPEAVKSLRRALDLDADNLDALSALARIKRERPQEPVDVAVRAASAAPPAERSWTQAEIERALRSDPGDLEALRQSLALARGRRRTPETDAAAERFMDAIDDAPAWQKVAAYHLITRTWLELDRRRQAWQSLQHALDLDPWSLETLSLASRTDEYDAAGSSTRPANSSDRSQHLYMAMDARIGIAHLRAGLGDDAGAEENLKNVIAQFPDAAAALASAKASPAERAEFEMRRARALLALGELTRMKLDQGRPAEALADNDRSLEASANAPPTERAAVYRQRAQIQLALKDPAGAEKSLALALRLLPDAAQARLVLGDLPQIELDRGRPDQALAGNDRSLEASEKAPPSERALIYRQRAQIQLALKDPAGAEKSLALALGLHPDAAQARLVLGDLAQIELDQGRPAEASADNDRSLEASANAPPTERAAVYRQRAQIQLALKDPAGAEKSLALALQLHPDAAQARLVLGDLAQIELDRGRPDQALTDNDRSLEASEKAPPSVRAAIYRQKAQIQLKLKDAAGAEKSLREALRLLPDAAQARLVLGDLAQIELDQGRSAEALADNDRSLEASANAPPTERAAVYRQRAQIQLALKDPAGAEKSLALALRLLPDAAQARLVLGDLAQIELDQDRPAEALADNDRSLEASEKAPPSVRAAIYRQKAQIQLKLKDAAGAEKSLREALRLLPDAAQTPLVLGDLAQIELDQGRLPEASADNDRALAASANAPPSERADAYRRRAKIQLALNDTSGAEKSLRAAIDAAPENLEALRMLVDADRSRPNETLSLVEGHRPSGPRLQAPWTALRGLARALTKNRPGADDDLKAAVAMDPNGVCFGEIFQENRDRLDPLYFDRCLERFPDVPALYSDRGVARFQAGQLEGAVADFRKAADARPNFLEARLSLATALAAENRVDEALAETDKALRLAEIRKGPVYDQLVALQKTLRAAGRKPGLPRNSGR
jgi:tetratricopeptide (TPR) repeat protein